MVFLLAGTSATGRPAEMGVVVEAYRAHLGGSTVSAGATVYDGDHFSTEEGGALRWRCKAALLELAEKSAVLVHRVGNETQDAEAELLEGTWDFSTARAGEFEIQAREAHTLPAGKGRTVAQVSVIGPKELHIYARRGAVLFSYRSESNTIAEGESYEVMVDPPADGSDKKQSAQKPGRPPKAFLLVAGGGGAAAAAVILYEQHKHKDVESPDHP